MQHFLDMNHLSRQQVEQLIERAMAFKRQQQFPKHSFHTVAHLFYENSTRTRVSFELAANRLSMPVVNLDLQSSSEAKGELVEDTVRNLAAMGITYFVLRHRQDYLPENLAKALGADIHVINAGDGVHAHPSQALLDIITIIEQKPALDKLKIAILGNIKHSRVANSLQHICRLLGVGELVLIAPKLWQPDVVHYGQVSCDLPTGLADADVVICLRVQRERLLENEHLDLASYRHDYALTAKSLAFAKPDAMVMHPGPMNRGVEIDSDVADGRQSFILQQVHNGVYARMAILDALID